MKDELSLLQAQLTYKKRLESMLKELRAQEEPLALKVAKLEERMLRERRDLDKLEGRSLSAFVFYALGMKEERLDTERREYYAARVKYDAAARELEAVRQDIEATEEDLQDLADCEARYACALEAKRQAIEATGTPEAVQLAEKKHALVFLQGQERELKEAIDAGTAALRTANDAASCLKDAESWGTFDLLGGGLLADMAKHESLDEAQQSIEQLQISLQRFNKEMSDVSIRADIQARIESMLKFADCFFDNIFTDAAVLDRIEQSHAQLDQTRDQILGVLRQLQTRLEEVRHLQTKNQQELDEMILSIEV